MRAKHYSFKLTKGGWGLLAVCVLLNIAAFRAGLNMTYLLASLLMALFLSSLILPLRNLRGLVCWRAGRDAAYADEPFGVDYLVYSTRRAPARLLRVEDPLCEAEGGGGHALAIEIPPRGRLRLSSAASARKRGVYPLPGLRWSCAFPFGVAEWRVRTVAAGELTVYPARGLLAAGMASALRPRGVRADAASRHGQVNDEFRSVREYQPGDNPRHIHWRVSAHRGKLHLREMERERSAPLFVLLDSRIPASTPEWEREPAAEALETAVSFAAEVCRSARAAGNGAVLIGFFPEPRVLRLVAQTGGASRKRLFRVLDALAGLQPSDAETAEVLLRTAQDLGMAPASGMVAVTPTSRSAAGLALQDMEPLKPYVAAHPGFASIFKPLQPANGRDHED